MSSTEDSDIGKYDITCESEPVEDEGEYGGENEGDADGEDEELRPRARVVPVVGVRSLQCGDLTVLPSFIGNQFYVIELPDFLWL